MKKLLILFILLAIQVSAQEILNSLVTPELIKKNKVKRVSIIYYQRPEKNPSQKVNEFKTGYVEYNRDGKPVRQLIENQQLQLFTYGPNYSWAQNDYYDAEGKTLRGTYRRELDDKGRVVRYSYRDLDNPINSYSATKSYTHTGKLKEDMMYDTLGKLRSGYRYYFDKLDSAAGFTFYQYGYAYTKNNKDQLVVRQKMDDEGNFESQTRFEYDPNGKLAVETDSAKNGKRLRREYTYDARGHILKIAENGKTTYDRNKEEDRKKFGFDEELPIADPVPENTRYPSLPYSQKDPVFLKNGLLKEYYDFCSGDNCGVTEYRYEYY